MEYMIFMKSSLIHGFFKCRQQQPTIEYVYYFDGLAYNYNSKRQNWMGVVVNNNAVIGLRVDLELSWWVVM